MRTYNHLLGVVIRRLKSLARRLAGRDESVYRVREPLVCCKSGKPICLTNAEIEEILAT